MSNLPNEIEVLNFHSIVDDRGSWLRVFDTLKSKNSDLCFSQISISNNILKGTLRGLHFQKIPFSEYKAIACLNGSIYDVVVDIRKDSVNYLKWYSTYLSSSDNKFLLVPPGYAHGFLTLEDDTQLIYGMDKVFSPKHYSGIHWNDPKIGVNWPDMPKVISDKDSSLPWL